MSARCRRVLVAASLAAVAILPVRASAQVNPDGSFVYQVPIDTATTAGGVEPHIALSYSSMGGDGPVGVGWRLSGLPAIVRINAGDGVNYDADDTFAAPGGKLLQVAPNAFHSENEDWIRYEQSGACGSGPCTWYAFMPDGTTAEYGSGTSAAWAGSYGIRSWSLSRFSDSYNRAYTVSYLDGGGGQRYPQAITWDEGDATIAPAMGMTFLWEDRPDLRASFDQGLRVHTTKRLKAIRVARGTALLREYRLEYVQSTITGRSELVRVRKIGSDGIHQERAWTFTWNDANASVGEVVHNQPTSLSVNDDYKWPLDVNGDGRSDLVFMNGGDCRVRVALAQADNSFAPVRTTSFTCSFQQTGYLWPGDYNGDGLTDIAWRRTEMVDGKLTYYPNVWVLLSVGDGTFSHATWQTGSSDWGTADVTFAGDFDGDGDTDLATRVSDGRILMRSSTGASATGFTASYWTIININVGNRPNRWTGDFDGDGKLDIAVARLIGGLVHMTVLRSTGNGFEAQDFLMGGQWNLAEFSRDTYLGDFNGDGRTDFLTRGDPHATTVYLHSYTANGFDVRTITGNPLHTTSPALGDFNGDHRTDFVECYTGTMGYLVLSTGEGFTRVLDPHRCDDASFGPSLLGVVGDFNGDGMSDNVALQYDQTRLHRTSQGRELVVAVDEGFVGATAPLVGISYTPAPAAGTAVHARFNQCGGGGAGNGQPCGRANPSPRPLVTMLERRDGRGAAYGTAYEYHNGRVYPGRAGVAANLGFERVTSRDLQTQQASDTWYAQVRPFHGQILRSRTYLPGSDPVEPDDDVLIAQVSNTGFLQQRCGENGCVTDNTPGTSFPRLVHADTTTIDKYELGTLLTSTKRTVVYDGYGSPYLVTEEVFKDGVRVHAHNVERLHLNKPQAPRVIGLPLQRREFGASLLELMLTEQYYFDDRPYGVVGQQANQTLVRRRRGAASSPWEETRRVFDEDGNLVVETDPRGLSTVFEYGADGRFLAAITELNQRSVVEIDPRSGQMLRVTGEGGLRTVRVLDVFFRQTEHRVEEVATGAVLRRTRYRHSSDGSVEGVCHDTGPNLSDAQCATSWKDALGREFLRWTPAGAASTSFDVAGRVWKVWEPYPQGGTPTAFTLHEYDSQGRAARVYAPDGALSRTGYNDGPIAAAAVTRTTQIDPLGNRRITHTDSQGQVVLVEEPAGPGGSMLATQYVYDAYDRLTRIEKADGSIVKFTYDGQSNRRSIVEPSTGTTLFHYFTTPGRGDYGQIAAEMRPDPNDTNSGAAVITRMAYDDLGRAVERSTSNGLLTGWSYDDTPSGGGRIRSVSYESPQHQVRTEFETDLLGREVKRVQTISGALSDGTALDWQVTFATVLDASDRPTAITYPDGQVATYSYPLSSSPGTLDATLGPASVEVGDFDTQRRPRLIKLGNGVAEHLVFDPATGRVVETSTDRASQLLTRRHYGFDARGLVTTLDDGVRPELSITYDYDAVRRLVRGLRADGRKFVYGFDVGSNLVNKTAFDGNGETVQLLRGVVPGTNRLAQDGLGNALIYSNGGQIVRRGDTEYTYDDAGMMSEVRKHGTVVERDLYDQNGKRVVSVEYDADGAVITYDADGLYQERVRVHGQDQIARQTTSALFVGDRRMAVVIAGDPSLAAPGAPPPAVERPGVRYFHADHLGSTSLVTDETGQVLADVVYSPYGEVDPAWGSPEDTRWLFTGAEQHSGSALMQLGWRAFDPVLGAFLQPDSLAANPFNGLDYNPYLYVRGNPVSYTDPTGHFPFLIVGAFAIAGAIIGASHGGVLSDPGHWMDLEVLWKEGDGWAALGGAVVGGLGGAGFWYLGGIGGSIFGTSIGAVLQSAALGGALEMATAYGAGHRDAGGLAGAFAIGAIDGVMARTGFFGAARAAFSGLTIFDSGGRYALGVIFYGLAIATDSMVSSALRRSFYEEDYPLEVSVFFVTFSQHRDGTWTGRISFAMGMRYLVATALASGKGTGGMLYDFSPLHRDRFYEGLKGMTGGNGFLPYVFAQLLEGTMILHDYHDVFDIAAEELDFTGYALLHAYGLGAGALLVHIPQLFGADMFGELSGCPDRSLSVCHWDPNDHWADF